MNDHELKALINTPLVTRSIRKGDIVVRVKTQERMRANVPIGTIGRVIELHSLFKVSVQSLEQPVTYTPVDNWQHATPAQILLFKEREKRERS